MEIRTDLAVEAKELCEDSSGILSSELTLKNIHLNRIEIQTEDAAKRCKKPVGKYISIDLPKLWSYDYDAFSECVMVTANELRSLLSVSPNDTVLVVGLGNDNITPDALGPIAVEHLMITRHLKENLPQWFESANLRQVGAICPNVLGNTGIEAVRIIKGVCEQIRPAAVIIVDALAARALPRLASTIQLSDTGIVPGSGVGNSREQISQDTLGVPVISIGVPTVVDAATLASDVVNMTFSLLEKQTGKPDLSFLSQVSPEDKAALFSEVLAPDDMNLFVSPKDVDRMIAELGKMVGFSINSALHSNISIEDMSKFTGS